MSDSARTGAMVATNDDERHRAEEMERRAKRKASKMSKSDAQKERDRQRKEYRQKILEQHGGQYSSSGAGGSSSSKRPKTPSSSSSPVPTSSAFQALFQQRAQGFQIDFRFRNAPPRPPVGPCFVGDTLQAVLLGQSRQYKALNAVEANYVWKLHTEIDLGVPLAPSAMDIRAYALSTEDKNNLPPLSTLHPDDQALLEWKGSMGDTAADQRTQRQEQVRAAARQWLQQGADGNAQVSKLKANKPNKKIFSRVLKEEMQTWMKKTTYLSNDYSRKVHDFKSLAQSKQELAVDLQSKQEEMAERRTRKAVEASFDKIATKTTLETLQHPTKKKLKPIAVLDVLPNVSNWGRAFTHVVIDKPPTNLPKDFTVNHLKEGAFVANVEKKGPTAHMSCQILAPLPYSIKLEDEKDKTILIPIQANDLDIFPLKEEDSPHVNFCLWVDKEKGVATYLPISSRIQLSTGRPVQRPMARALERRPLTDAELKEIEERMAEVDQDMAEKHNIARRPRVRRKEYSSGKGSADDGNHNSNNNRKTNDSDDGEDDFGDDDSDSDDEQVFGGGNKTFVAED